VAVVLSGGNMDPDMLAQILAREAAITPAPAG